MARQQAWLTGDVVVRFRCGVMVMRSGEQWGFGDVFRVYQKAFYVDGTFEWRRDDRLFTHDDAVENATRRVEFEEGRKDPVLEKLWATAPERPRGKRR